MKEDSKMNMYLLLEEQPKRDHIPYHSRELKIRREGDHRDAPLCAERSYHRISTTTSSIAKVEKRHTKTHRCTKRGTPYTTQSSLCSGRLSGTEMLSSKRRVGAQPSTAMPTKENEMSTRMSMIT
jgi:hypothetical protein